MLDPVLASLLVLGGGTLFLTAAVHKLRAPARFAEAVAGYRILPARSVRPIAVVLPVVELAIAVALLWSGARETVLARNGYLHALAASSAAALLLIYACAIAVNLARGRRDLDCGCGASSGATIGGWMVTRNLVMSVALLASWLPLRDRALTFADIATISAGFVVTALLYASADLLLSRTAPSLLPTLERS